jgi:L-fucose mutarotase/ribose pyranase (RbsD/FucU family)
MNSYKNILILFLASLILGACNQSKVAEKTIPIKETNNQSNWKLDLEAKLKLYGHRNWIVIADAAYPQQSNPAIEPITIDASQLEAVEYVSSLLTKAAHVDANIFIDKEMAFVSEKNAQGITDYRNKLNKVLEGKSIKTMLHEDIIRELDASAKLFNVLIIKTDLAIPYTSVFFQLECGYWNESSENELRKAIN